VGLVFVAACGGGGTVQGDAQPPLPQSGCGDGIASGGEMCDGSDLRGRADCQQLGYYDSAPLACTATCELDTSQCTGTCGDGVVQPEHEFCDGADPSATCTDYGFGAGALTCERCGPDFGDCKFFGWHRDYLPFEVSSLSGTNASDVWVTGSGGTLHWDGATWQPFAFPGACAVPVAAFDAIAAVAADDIWFGGGETIVHLSGGTCVKYFLGGANTVMASNIVALADDDVWLRGFSTVWHFDGQSWTKYDVMLETMWVAGHDDVWGVDGSSAIRHFDGSSWTTTALDPQRWLYTIWGTGPNDIYAGGRNTASASPFDTSVIEHFDGNAWSEITLHEPIEQNDFVTSIAGADNHIFIGLHNTNAIRVLEPTGFATLATPELRAQTQIYAFPGHLFVIPHGFPQLFRFDGTDQFDRSLGPPSSVAPASAAEIYAIITPSTADNHLYAYDGFYWRQDTSVPYVRSVATALSGDVLLLANDGIHTRTGATWSTATPITANGDRMWAASPSDVWIQDLTNHLHHWDGMTETVCASCAFPSPVRTFWGSSSTDIYAIGDAGLFKHWDGLAWSDAPAPSTFRPSALFGWAANDIAALDDAGAVWHFDGTAWTQLAFPYPNLQPRYLWGTSLHDLFIVSDTAVFHYDGVRWSPVAIPNAYWLTDITGAGDTTVLFEHSGPAHHLVRTHPWD
jgi:hypothetical protein